MDLNRIKNLVKQNGDKFILIEDGEPEVMVMSFREYERLANGNAGGTAAAADDFIAEETSGFTATSRTAGTEFLTSVEFSTPSVPGRREDIRLEDLPL